MKLQMSKFMSLRRILYPGCGGKGRIPEHPVTPQNQTVLPDKHLSPHCSLHGFVCHEQNDVGFLAKLAAIFTWASSEHICLHTEPNGLEYHSFPDLQAACLSPCQRRFSLGRTMSDSLLFRGQFCAHFLFRALDETGWLPCVIWATQAFPTTKIFERQVSMGGATHPFPLPSHTHSA